MKEERIEKNAKSKEIGLFPKHKSMTKNELEISERLTNAENLLISGYDRSYIINYLVEEYNCTYMAAEVVYDKSYRRLRDNQTSQIVNIRDIHSVRYDEIYRLMRERNWNKLALTTLKQKEKLLRIEEQEQLKLLSEANQENEQTYDEKVIGNELKDILNKIGELK